MFSWHILILVTQGCHDQGIYLYFLDAFLLGLPRSGNLFMFSLHVLAGVTQDYHIRGFICFLDSFLLGLLSVAMIREFIYAFFTLSSRDYSGLPRLVNYLIFSLRILAGVARNREFIYVFLTHSNWGFSGLRRSANLFMLSWRILSGFFTQSGDTFLIHLGLRGG